MPLQAIQELALGLRDVLAPARCMRCLQEDTWFCPVCAALVRPYPLACIVCSKKHPRGLTCSSCKDETTLTGAITAGAYHTQWLRRGIGWLKFKGIQDVAPHLALLLVPQLMRIAPLSQLREQAVFLPIPLHSRRQRQRGFNQSLLIGESLTNLTNIPTLDILIRPKSTWSQAHLPHDLREDNIEDAFRIKEGVPTQLKSKRFIILVDDVTTSGATLSAAADALRSHVSTSTQLWGATIARG